MAKAIREVMEILYRCPCMAEKCGAAASSSDVNQQKHMEVRDTSQFALSAGP